MSDKPIYVVGDIHGRLDLLTEACRKFDFLNCHMICVGDFGVGFKHNDKMFIEALNGFMANRKIDFMTIRGNHDDPKFFNGDFMFSHVKLLPDYSMRILNDEKFLFVGGAISVDRVSRVEGVSYWIDEPFVLDASRVEPCDVLITHSAPTWNGPLDKLSLNQFCNWERDDPTLWEETLKERKDHDKLIRMCGARSHYCGHFHSYHWVDMNGCYSTIVPTLEFKQHVKICDAF
jgi:hypothetical protein